MPVCVTHCRKWSGGKDKQKVEEYHHKGKSWEITNPNENNGETNAYKTYKLKEKNEKNITSYNCSYSNDRFRSIHHPNLDVS